MTRRISAPESARSSRRGAGSARPSGSGATESRTGLLLAAAIASVGCVEASASSPRAPAVPEVKAEDIVLPNGERFGVCPSTSTVRGYPMVKGATATYCATIMEPSLRDGRFVSFHPNGKLVAEGEYHAGNPNGAWRTYHENGQVMSEGAYTEGLRYGKWVFQRSDGQPILQEVLEGGRRVSWTEYDYAKDTLVAFESFRAVKGEAVSEGPAGRRLANGSTIRGDFAGGKATGVWEERSPKGVAVMRLPMIAGFAEGDFSVRWPATGGPAAQGKLLKTLPQGDWALASPSGKRLADVRFEKGILRSLTVYHEAGDKRLSGEFLDGAPHATWTVLHPGGAVETTGAYARGVRQGMWRTADATGRPIAEGLYENGVLVEGQAVGPIVWSSFGLGAPLQDLFEALAFVTAGRGDVEVEQRLLAECVLFGDPAEKCQSLDWENMRGAHANDTAAEIEHRNRRQDLACAMNDGAACARVGKRLFPGDATAAAERKKGIATAAGFYQKACDLSPSETAWKARDASAKAMYKGFHAANACVWLGELIASGDVKSKAQTPLDLYQKACEQGVEAGCTAAEEARSKVKAKPGQKAPPSVKSAPAAPAKPAAPKPPTAPAKPAGGENPLKL